MESMVVSEEFWKGQRVLVTGHTGFKGSWLSHWLKNMGAHVLGLSLEPQTDPSLFHTAGIEKGMDHVIGNIRDGELVKKIVREFQPEMVFHLAAQALVRYSYDEPEETFGTNVMGSLNILQAIGETPGVKAMVFVTTDKCYDNKEWIWPYRENEPLGGKDPYSASKACAEILAASYAHSFFQDATAPNLATARAGNVIGGGDWSLDRLLPDAMRAFSAGKTVQIRNPVSVRPWQHVLDALSGYLVLAQKLAGPDGKSFAGAYNFGPDQSSDASVLDVVSLASKSWGGDAAYVSDKAPSGPYEATYLRLDSSKAREKLQWVPRWGLQEAIAKTVQWHKAFQEGRDIPQLMDEQISQISSIKAPEQVSSFPGEK